MTSATNDFKAADDAAERAADKTANKTDEINVANRTAEIKAADTIVAPTRPAPEGQPNLAHRFSGGNGSQRIEVPEGRPASHSDPAIGRR